MKNLLKLFSQSTLSIIGLSLMFFSSCVTQKNVEYIQDKDTTEKVFKEAPIEDYRLKTNDELYIQISSIDDVTTNLFTGIGGTPSTFSSTMTPYGASLISYVVDKEGYLHMPVIGKLYVKDKTMAEVSELLKESLTNILNQPLVTVKLVNRYVSVLGEVKLPGHYTFSQDKLTIFDAISLAGDINDFGNRKEVVLTRNENGQNIKINLNLTTSDILASNYYYLRPNDIVYVKPLRRKFWDLRQFPYSIILSTITTAILVYSVSN
jgi:polysaccharide biosynthesis/export protein